MIADMHTALGKTRVTTRWDLDCRKKRNQSTHQRQVQLDAVGCVKHKLDDDVGLDMEEYRLHRGAVGSLQYLSIDRCVQFETNACAKKITWN